MRPFSVIPAMDLLDGAVVRLFRGDYSRLTTYPVDPVDLARQFLDAGLTKLHMVDLEGARSGAPAHLGVVAEVAGTGIKIELGGGIRSEVDIERAFDAGANEIILGTALLGEPEQLSRWIDRFSGRLIAAIDSHDGRIAIRGWKQRTTIDSKVLLAQLERLGMARAIVTDIATDGVMQGPNLAYLRQVADSTTMEITASGGVARPEHLRQIAALSPHGVSGVIVGRAFYEGTISLAEMARC